MSQEDVTLFESWCCSKVGVLDVDRNGSGPVKPAPGGQQAGCIISYRYTVCSISSTRQFTYRPFTFAFKCTLISVNMLTMNHR